MNEILIGLGTNLGDRKANIEKAYLEIEKCIGSIDLKSSFYETPPWGYDSQQDFLNTVIKLNTDFDALELLKTLKQIEEGLGRKQKKENTGYQDRLIDLDIIDCNAAVFHLENLTIPHEKMHLRSFVLFPLLEIAPNWVHPIFKKSAKTLIAENLENALIERLV